MELIQRRIKDNINMDNFEKLYEFAEQFNLIEIIDSAKLYLKINLETLFENDYDTIIRINLLAENYLVEIIEDEPIIKLNLDSFGNCYKISKQFKLNSMKSKVEQFVQDNFDSILNMDMNQLKLNNNICDNFLFELLLKDRNVSKFNEQQLLKERDNLLEQIQESEKHFQ